MGNSLYTKGDAFFSSGRTYTVISVIKTSDYSEVYRIERQSDAKSFLLKVLKLKEMPDRLIIKKKPRIIRYLDTTNIAQHLSVFDWGAIDTDHFFIISRYFTKGLLSDRLRQGSLKLNTAVNLVLDLAKTLSSLQAYDSTSFTIRRMRHGDLCPHNIMYDFDEKGDYKTYLIDMEHISHIAYDFHDADISPVISDIETKYSAPEVIEDEPVYNSDVFSLGIILYECCFGEYPFTANGDGWDFSVTPYYLGLNHCEGYPGILISILSDMLERDPVKRVSMETVIMKLNALSRTIKTFNYELNDERCFDQVIIETFEQNFQENKLPYHLDMSERLFRDFAHDPEMLDPQQKKKNSCGEESSADSASDADDSSKNSEETEIINQELGYRPLVKKPDKNARGFKDVAGMEDLKNLMHKKVLFFLQNPELADEYKISCPNGMLLYGPPGCGKTYFAEKFAEESGFAFALVKASDLGSTWIHGTQGKINELFKEARNNAPCVICFDEFDAFAPERSKLQNSNISGEVNEFLSQLNNCGKDRIFIIATTNNPEGIDPAILRSGRIEHKVYIPAPDFEARKAVIKHGVLCRPCTDSIDFDRLAKLTEGYITSDLALIVNDAAMNAAYTRGFISQELLEEAISCYKPSVSDRILKEHEEIRKRMESEYKAQPQTRIGFK